MMTWDIDLGKFSASWKKRAGFVTKNVYLLVNQI